MSTILDALKKVEQERETDATAAQRRQLEAMHATADKHRQARGRKVIISGMLLMLFLVMGGITYYLFRGNQDPLAPKATAPATDEPKSTIPQKKMPQMTARTRPTQALSDKPMHSAAPREDQHQSFETKVAPSLAKKPEVRPQANEKLKKQVPNKENKQAKTESRPQTLSNPNSPSNTAQVPSVAKQTPKDPSAQQSEPTATRPSTRIPTNAGISQRPSQIQNVSALSSNSHIERLTDGSLNVQAIAWSPDAEESMAVINSKIVYKGSSVDGYTLVTIGQDEVVVRKGGREWRVVIGRP